MKWWQVALICGLTVLTYQALDTFIFAAWVGKKAIQDVLEVA